MHAWKCEPTKMLKSFPYSQEISWGWWYSALFQAPEARRVKQATDKWTEKRSQKYMSFKTLPHRKDSRADTIYERNIKSIDRRSALSMWKLIMLLIMASTRSSSRTLSSSPAALYAFPSFIPSGSREYWFCTIARLLPTSMRSKMQAFLSASCVTSA